MTGPRQPLLLVIGFAASAALAEAGPGQETPATAGDERPAHEPETRAESWRRLREAKLDELEAYRPGFLERQILAFEKAERPSIFDFNVAGFYPRIQGIAKGSQNAIGVRLWQPDIGGSPLDLHGSAFYSINDYELYDLQFGVIPGADVRLDATATLPLRSTKGDDVFELATITRPDRPSWGVYGTARYQHYTQLPFFGLGRESQVGDQTTFLQRDTLYEIAASWQSGRLFLVSLNAGHLEAGIGPGEDTEYPSLEQVFDQSHAPGLEQQPRYWTAGLVLQLDSRDVVSNPGRGAVLALHLQRYDDPDNRFSFSRLAVDGRAFLPLGSPQRLLALRGYAVRDEADEGQVVPFFMQQPLGGSHTLRGYRNFRFRGEKLALLQAEYRWEAVSALEFALFVDSGVVAQAGQSLDLQKLRTSWGAGIRFKTPQSFLARLDWARGPEDNRFYLRFSQGW